MKTIVHVCLNGVVTDNFGYQDNLLPKYHKRQGYQVAVITSKWIFNQNGMMECCGQASYINKDNVKMIRLDIRKSKDFFFKFKTYRNLEQTLQQEQPDILFVHGCQFLDVLTIVKYLRQNKGVRVYVDNHADFSNSATNWLSKNILHKMLWRYMAHIIEPFTTKFYGVLPARVDFLKNVYKLPPEKCELLVMGADDEKVEEAECLKAEKNIRVKYNIAPEDFLIMTGGKIDLWKTQTFLLMKAVQNIDNPKVKLIVFGSVTTELKDRMRELADGKKIQYIGWIASEESYHYFEASDLVVFPGRHSVFWEQVTAQGIPMLCKYWDGTTHVDIGGNVEFLYRDTSSEIQRIIEQYLEDNDRYEKMLVAARKTERSRFLYSKIARKSIGINET